MTKITPTIRLFTYQESLERGLQRKSLMLEHNGIRYHLHGGTRDTIHVFTESICIYVLTINKALGYIGLNAYMTPEPDPINCVYLHNYHEIRETLGAKWEGMKPLTMASRLIHYLY